MADIWRRLGRAEPADPSRHAGSHRRGRDCTAIVANIGIAVAPNEEWNATQTLHFVEAQKAVNDVTGLSLRSQVVRGTSLPPWGPANRLFVVGDCDGLYISNGEDYSTVPDEQYTRDTWMTVELGHTFEHTFGVTADASAPKVTAPVPAIHAGTATISVGLVPATRPGRSG